MRINNEISTFIENNDELINSITELANQSINVSKILKRMESQQAVSKTVNDSMHKRFEKFEKLSWRNA